MNEATTRATAMQIREATTEDLATIAMLVSESNKDVAVKFGLNAENCPKHPSFCTEAWVKADLARGETYFILEVNSKPIACVAYESPSTGLAYLNRLSVLPAHRNRGAGARLVQHIVQHARSASIQTISIGVIGEHIELQRWYDKLGFRDGETKHFPHLPFSVKYMAYEVPRMNSGPGLAVLYRWRLHPGSEDAFVQAWSRVSDLLLTRHGSLGSRLHKGPEGVWYSYAQWPSTEAREKAFAVPFEDPEAMAAMRAAVAESFPEIVLESVADFMVLPLGGVAA